MGSKERFLVCFGSNIMNKLRVNYLLILSFCSLHLIGGFSINNEMDFDRMESHNNLVQVISNVEIEWMDEFMMKVTWSDGNKEYLLLNSLGNLPQSCLFEGESHKSGAVAAVVGCIDSDETIVNLGSAIGMWELTLLRNGTTLQSVVNPIYDVHLRKKREMIETGGYNRDPRMKQEYTEDDIDVIIPSTITIPLQLGYDKKLLDHFNGDKTAAELLLHKVKVLAQFYFKLPKSSLPKISWTIDTTILCYDDLDITADEYCEEGEKELDLLPETPKVEKLTHKRKGETKPFVLFTVDLHEDGKQIGGCANIGKACHIEKGHSVAVVDMTWKSDSDNEQIQQMARTMAHEFGHLIGMEHNPRYPDINGCYKAGIMSYFKRTEKMPQMWTECSVDDFKQWWRSFGHKCSTFSSIVCPHEDDDHCPENELRAYRVSPIEGKKKLNCWPVCSRVTALIRSTNDSETMATGFRCIESENEIDQWDWCCQRTEEPTHNPDDVKKGGIVHCTTLDDAADQCPTKGGCPIAKVKMVFDPNAPKVPKLCDINDECDHIMSEDENDPYSGIKCTSLKKLWSKRRFCCTDPDANSNLPKCSQL